MKHALVALVLIVLVSGCTSLTGEIALKEANELDQARTDFQKHTEENSDSNETCLETVQESPIQNETAQNKPENRTHNEAPATANQTQPVESCKEDWLCGEWGACENGWQSRVCIDANACGTEELLTERTCDMPEPGPAPEEPEQEPEQQEPKTPPEEPDEQQPPDEPDPTPHHVVFAEVFYDTPGFDSVEEWIKLYNPAPEDLDISGYVIEDNSRSWNMPNGTVIPSQDHLVIARNKEGFHNLTGCWPDLDRLTLALSNNGDVLILKADGQEIDRVSWEGFEPGWDISASEGKSIRRASPETDSPANWLDEQEPLPC